MQVAHGSFGYSYSPLYTNDGISFFVKACVNDFTATLVKVKKVNLYSEYRNYEDILLCLYIIKADNT